METRPTCKEFNKKAGKVFYDNIIQTTLDGFWLVGTNGKLLDVNSTYSVMSGYSKAELLNMSIPDIEASETAYETANQINNIITTGSGRFESVHRRKDGSTFQVEISTTFLPTENEFVAFIRDITERKQTREALRESTSRLTNAQRLAHIGNWELDHVKNELHWSDEIFSIFEIDKDVFGASYDSFLAAIHPEDRDAVNAAFTQSLETRESYIITHRLLMSDGRIKNVEEQCETNFNSEGKPLRSFGTVQDITERKQAEEEKCNLELRLQQAQKMEAIGTLAGGIAHDFNNILSAILGYAEIAKLKLPEDSRAGGDIDQVIKSGKRATDLVKQILTFSRKSNHQLQPLIPHLIVKEALKLLRSSLPTTLSLK